jgi:hypothetical protein
MGRVRTFLSSVPTQDAQHCNGAESITCCTLELRSDLIDNWYVLWVNQNVIKRYE